MRDDADAFQMLRCHGALKKSLPNSRGGETSIESMMQTDSLNRSLLSYFKDMKQYLHATWRIFGFRQPNGPRLRSGAGSFAWPEPVVTEIREVWENQHSKTLKGSSAVWSKSHIIGRVVLFFFFRICWGSFSSSADITAVEDVTGCVKVRTDSEFGWWKLSSEAVIKWFAGRNMRLREDAERPI